MKSFSEYTLYCVFPGVCQTQNEYQKDSGRESGMRTWAVEMYKEKPGSVENDNSWPGQKVKCHQVG